MRERHSTRAGSTDNTPARSVKFMELVVENDLNFCRRRAVDFARRAVYSRDQKTRRALATMARGWADLARVGGPKRHPPPEGGVLILGPVWFNHPSPCGFQQIFFGGQALQFRSPFQKFYLFLGKLYCNFSCFVY